MFLSSFPYKKYHLLPTKPAEKTDASFSMLYNTFGVQGIATKMKGIPELLWAGCKLQLCPVRMNYSAASTQSCSHAAAGTRSLPRFIHKKSQTCFQETLPPLTELLFALCLYFNLARMLCRPRKLLLSFLTLSISGRKRQVVTSNGRNNLKNKSLNISLCPKFFCNSVNWSNHVCRTVRISSKSVNRMN